MNGGIVAANDALTSRRSRSAYSGAVGASSWQKYAYTSKPPASRDWIRAARPSSSFSEGRHAVPVPPLPRPALEIGRAEQERQQPVVARALDDDANRPQSVAEHPHPLLERTEIP